MVQHQDEKGYIFYLKTKQTTKKTTTEEGNEKIKLLFCNAALLAWKVLEQMPCPPLNIHNISLQKNKDHSTYKQNHNMFFMKKKKKEDAFKDLGRKKRKKDRKEKKKKPRKHCCSLKKQRLLEAVHILRR